jgi:predicted enzyme related to lactoylglutathione lyase
MPAATDLRIQRIGQISIIVKDVDRATAFYRDRLGLRHLFSVPKMSFFDCGGTRLMLGIAETPEFDHPSSTLYFDTQDIEGSHASLVKAGVKSEGEPHKVADLGDRDLWLAFFRDTEGNFMALMEEKPHAR